MRSARLAFVAACAAAVAAGAQATRPAFLPAPASTHPAVQRAPLPALATATQPSTSAFAASSAASAVDPATHPDFPDPDQFLRRLSSPDWRVRRDAQDELVRWGEPAKGYAADLVRRAPDDESRKNAQAAIVRIDENRVLGPSYITLHVRDASAASVFAQISAQCFAPLPTMPENLWEQQGFPTLTLDIDRRPFWEVMPKICRRLGVDFRPYQYGMRVMRTGAQTQGISDVEGPFIVTATQITYNRTRMLGAAGAQHTQFGISLTVCPEPKITVLRRGSSIHLDEATDDHGNSLLPPTATRQRGWGGFGFGGWSLYVPLQYPQKNPGSKIVTLRGSTSFLVQTQVRTLRIPDIMNVKSIVRNVHGMDVTFAQATRKGANYELKLSVARPNFGSPEWPMLMQEAQTRLKLEDSAGNPLDHRGMATTANNNAIDLTLTFARGYRPNGHPTGEPARLVWEIPTESRQITVPMRFKDIPLFDAN